jgi:hypothetical protein
MFLDSIQPGAIGGFSCGELGLARGVKEGC